MQHIIDKIQEADMILLGLGEDFDNKKYLNSIPNYVAGCEKLKNAGCAWLIPAWGEFCTEKIKKEDVSLVLNKLVDVLKDKNYFVVSVSTNSIIGKTPWKYERIVMPCGSSLKKQCVCGCDAIADTTETDIDALYSVFEKLYIKDIFDKMDLAIGKCEKCGEPLIFNNIYAETYREEGYLSKWELYMKWLQGTLNRKLFVLELGVGLEYPSVIRWPFERVAFLNEKAYFCRVHERLYQLTPELAEKGCGISSNAIDWLKML